MHMEFPSKFTQAEGQDDNPTSSTKVKQLSSDNKNENQNKTHLTNKHNQKNPHHQNLEKYVYQRFLVSTLLGN